MNTSCWSLGLNHGPGCRLLAGENYHNNSITGNEKDNLTLNSSNVELSITEELATAPTWE